jgi:putative ABC transport system permease protein
MRLLATVVRGLRSRGLLSLTSVILAVLAIGSAALGPIFQQTASSSYLHSRLETTPQVLTGLTWTLHPRPGAEPRAAVQGALAEVERIAPAEYADPDITFESDSTFVGDGRTLAVVARTGACDHLEIRGLCPERPGEALVQESDVGSWDIGDTVPLGDPVGPQRIVGVYTSPGESDEFWFQPGRLARVDYRDYTALAPLVVPTEAFEDLPSGWQAHLEARLVVPADLEAARFEGLVEETEDMSDEAVRFDGGRLEPQSDANALRSVLSDVRAEQDAAGSAISPAMLSLILVALAMVLRLLIAATELRVPELALASLRGVTGRKLWGLGLAEPLLLVALSIPLGLAAGIGAAHLLARAWLVPGIPVDVPTSSLTGALAVAAAIVAVACLAVWLVLRESVGSQLDGVSRPGRARHLAVLVEVVVVLSAAALTLGRLTADGQGQLDGGDLLLPVLLAVAAGLLGTRLVIAAARWWTARHRGRSISGFVASRALSRRTEGTLVILPLTAAIAVGAFALGIDDAARTWRHSVAATEAPAATVLASPLPMDATVELTNELDPDGRWLAAAATIDDPAGQLLVVDTRRLPEAGTWPESWTPGMSGDEVARALRGSGEPVDVVGRELGLTATVDATSDRDLTVQLRLRTVGGELHTVHVGPFRPGESTRSVAVGFCESGCELGELSIGGPGGLPTQASGTMRLSDLSADGQVVDGFADAQWVAAPVEGSMVTDVESDGSSVVVAFDSGAEQTDGPLVVSGLDVVLPALVGVDAGPLVTDLDDGPAVELAREPVPIDPVDTGGSVESMPFLGPVGAMFDYRMFTRDQIIPDALTETWVLAAADTPSEVRSSLATAGLEVEASQAEAEDAQDHSAYALALRLYAVSAGIILLMALVGLLVSIAVQLPARRRDAAALRVVGVRRATVVTSVAAELVVVLSVAAAAGLAAGVVAQEALLRTLTLGIVDDRRMPRVTPGIDLGLLLVVALAVAAVLLSVAVLSALGTVRRARGATLRESAR